MADLEWDLPEPFAMKLDVKASDIDRLGHVNHAAFIDDATALVGTIGGPTAGDPLSRFNTDVESIRTEGDKAFVTIRDVDQPIQLVRRDGRWYLRLLPDDL